MLREGVLGVPPHKWLTFTSRYIIATLLTNMSHRDATRNEVKPDKVRGYSHSCQDTTGFCWSIRMHMGFQ
ncbi:hypothetical protein WJX77_004323 [Trebouxia sp. C0004]